MEKIFLLLFENTMKRGGIVRFLKLYVHSLFYSIPSKLEKKNKGIKWNKTKLV